MATSNSLGDPIIVQWGTMASARQFLEVLPCIVGKSDLFRGVAFDPLLNSSFVRFLILVGFAIIHLGSYIVSDRSKSYGCNHTSSSPGLRALYFAAASLENDPACLPGAAFAVMNSARRTVHAVLGFVFGVDNATALSSLIFTFSFCSGVTTFFLGLAFTFGLTAAFFLAGFFTAFFAGAFLYFGFAEVEVIFAAVANDRRDMQEN
jgi:hypothetical protein